MSITYITYASKEKLCEIIEREKVSNDLRLPKILKNLIKNIVIYGQVWGRRGNTKLISVVLFTNQLNDNHEIQDKICELIQEEEPSCSITFHPTQFTMTLNIFSKNLANILKSLTQLVKYLMTDLDLSEDLINVNISTDLPNWKGTNFYLTDVCSFVNILQTTNCDTQHGAIYLNPYEVDDMELMILIQSAITLFPRMAIKVDCDEMAKQFLIRKIEDLVFETKLQINMSHLKDILICEVDTYEPSVL